MSKAYCICAHVSGQVQGVFYRACTRDAALRLNLRGYAKNLPDGRVEAVAVGDRDNVQQLINWLHQGSPASSVDHVEWKEVTPPLDLSESFKIR